MKNSLFSRWIVSLIVIVLLSSVAVPVSWSAEPGQLDPLLLEELAASPGPVDFLVFVNTQADLSFAATLQSRVEKGQYVYETLRAVADQSQARLRADLDAWGAPYHPFYIVNALRVTGDEALARKLAARPEVARVAADPAFNGLDDLPPVPSGPPAVNAVEWNISRVNADDVWPLGYTGQNIVVGSCDSGVDWTHPALINQYRGGAGNHDYHWYDAFYEYTEPTDPNGHGTHTTGTMVGDDGDANQVGMAPGAQWIACKVNSGSVWKASKYLECWEWFLAPTRVDGTDPDPSQAPHIINNSWSCPGSEGCDPDTLRDATKALYAAGIAIAKSAGNSGSACETITNPGQYPELLATASFNSSDVIAGSSSRGPVIVDGELLIKPDIAAPGVNIRSTTPGGGYGTSSGTSMAAPHTAGLIALLWSAQPALIGDLETTFQIVRASAEPRTTSQGCGGDGPTDVPNNVWGWGILDALAAVQVATDAGLGVLNGTITDSGDSSPLPGAEVEIVLAGNGPARRVAAGPSGTYSETLLAATYDVTATHYGYLPAMDTAVVVSNTVTTLNLALDPAATWTLSGTVTEQGSGEPLRATLSLLNTPVSADTEPDTGGYGMVVAEGDYVLRADSPGYEFQEVDISVQADLIQDFELQPEITYYVRDSLGPCGPDFDWIDITATGQPYNLGDDSNQYVSLGGSQFTFYGNSYDAFYIGSNGFVTFGSGSSYPGGNTIPSTFLPNNAIYAFWDDLNPSFGTQGTIYTELVDEHLYVVEFYQVEHYDSGNPETFEIILDLDTGAITLQYLEVSEASWTSVGIENSDGTAGLGYAFHDPDVPTDTLAVTFYPVTGAHPAEQGVGTLEGTVVDAFNEQPIAGATIALESFTFGQVLSYTTDAAGVYSGTACADMYTMTAQAYSYYPADVQQVDIISDSLTTQDLALQPYPADLWIAKTVPVSVALAGELLTYTVSFGNAGPGMAINVGVADEIPDGMTYVTSTMGTLNPFNPAQLGILVGTLLPGDELSFTLTVLVSSTLEDGLPLTNTAYVTSGITVNGAGPGTPDSDLENNVAPAYTTVESPYFYVYLPLVVKESGQ